MVFPKFGIPNILSVTSNKIFLITINAFDKLAVAQTKYFWLFSKDFIFSRFTRKQGDYDKQCLGNILT